MTIRTLSLQQLKRSAENSAAMKHHVDDDATVLPEPRTSSSPGNMTGYSVQVQDHGPIVDGTLHTPAERYADVVGRPSRLSFRNLTGRIYLRQRGATRNGHGRHYDHHRNAGTDVGRTEHRVGAVASHVLRYAGRWEYFRHHHAGLSMA